MIRYSDEEGFIRPHGIKYRENQDKNIKLPKVAVGVFSRHLFEDVIEKFSSLEVGYISCANMDRNVYIIKYKDVEITFFMAGVSGPWIAGDIEELYAAGVEKVIIFGNCGDLMQILKIVVSLFQRLDIEMKGQVIIMFQKVKQ